MSQEEFEVERPEDEPSEVAATGHRQVDDALAALARVADAPPADQVGPLAAAHDVLRQTLDAIGRTDAR